MGETDRTKEGRARLRGVQRTTQGLTILRMKESPESQSLGRDTTGSTTLTMEKRRRPERKQGEGGM